MGALPTITQRIDTTELKRGVDCRAVAQALGVELHKKTPTESAGACPRCGGNDRFVVMANVWQCRQCHGWADAIALVRHVAGVDFWTACNRLAEAKGGGALKPPPAQIITQRPHERRGWQRGTREAIRRAAETLRGSEEAHAVQARKYLRGRALGMDTAQRWGLGVLDHPKYGSVLTLPWYAQGEQVEGVQYRILSMGNDRRRYAMRKGSEPRLFGRQLLQPAHDRVLLAVEGELNALSVWQAIAATGWQVDVVSFGGEGVGGLKALCDLSEGYGATVVWADKPQALDRLSGDLDMAQGGADALRSPKGLDANDLLQRRQLVPFLRAWFLTLYKRLSLCIAAAYEDAIGSDKELLLARHERLDEAGVAMVKAGLM